MIAVTRLLDLLNKPALLFWANKIGLKGLSLNEYYKESSGKGIKKHHQIENYLLNGVEFEEVDKLNKCLKNYEVLAIERSVNNGYIKGRIDLIIRDSKNVIIVDFKSSTNIYIQQKLQLSTYKEIYNADKIAIINFDKWELEFINIDTKKYYEIVKRLYQINELLISLKEKL
jgi:predicted RecB family nuclease